MTLNEVNKNNDNTSDSIGRCVVTVKNSTSNKKAGYFVKARRAMGMTILTARYAEKGMMYNVTVDKHGVITYTPLAAIPMEDITNNNINLCKAMQCSTQSIALNAAGVARLGEYYMPAVDEKGIITYTPLRLALERLQEEE